MRVMILGVAFLLSQQTASAQSPVQLLQAAGFSAFSDPIAAADFELPNLEGRMLRLREQRGKVIFLNFWATWCVDCQREMPLMNRLYRSLRDKPFVMWAVDLRESRGKVSRFTEEYGLTFPALLDREGVVSARYRVWGLPVTYLINCDGKIVGRAVGARHWTNVATRTLLATLISAESCDRDHP